MPVPVLTRRDLPGGDGRASVRFVLTGQHSAGGRTLAEHTGADPAQVSATRTALAVGLDLAPDAVVYARQVHGCAVAVVAGPHPGGVPAVDALVSATPGLALAVLVADCVPVLLADPTARVVGVAHAGRRGMDAGVVGAAVTAMRELGALHVAAVLGPSVCPRCYEVPAPLRADVASRHPLSASLTWRGTPSLDVAAGVMAQLVDAGVDVEQLPGCTAERSDLASVRRDGPHAPRQAGLAWLLP